MDIEYLLWLKELRGGFLDSVLMAVTDFVISPVMYAFIAIIYWCFNKRAASFLAMNLSVGAMVNQALKNTFCVYRPWIKHPEIAPLEAAKKTATGYSFPSGHTQIAASEFLSIAIWQRKRKWVVALCVFMTFLVMFTRNYLGVHTPQDVIASLVISCVVIYINAKLFEWVDGGKNRDLIVFVIESALAAAFLLYTTIKPYPLDYSTQGVLLQNPEEMITDCYVAAGCVFGYLIGWITERRFVKFKTDVPAKIRVIRGSVGSVVLYLFAEFIKEPMTQINEHWGEFMFFFIAFVFIMALFPAIFTSLEKIIKKEA